MISQELQLDVSSAEQTINLVDSELQRVAELFKVALADALTILQQPLVAEVQADTTQAEAGIAALAIAPPVDVPVAADTVQAEQMILDLGQQPPIDIPVAVDDSAARDELTQLAASAPPIDVLVEADTQGAQQSIDDLGGSAVASSEGVGALEGSVTGLGAAAGIAEGSAKELVGVIGELGGGEGKAAAGGILAVAGATTGFFEEGLKAVSAGQRFDLILGEMADKARAIDVNGLKTSLSDLGLQFGSTSADMENATSKLVQFGINSGASKEESILFAQQIETLSARAISLNPQLGTLADVTESLGQKIGRGGRFAAQYGLDLNAAEIATRALADTGKSAASELTFTEKAIAGAEIASQKYGDTLAGTVAEGEKNAAIQAESLKARFKEAIEQIGVPLVAPVLDLIKQAEPDAVLIAQDLALLGKDALPAVTAALAALDPPLRLVSAVLDAIPSPIVAGTIAFFGFNAALGALVGLLPEAAVGFLGLEAAIPVVAGVAAVAVGVMALFGQSNDDSQKHVADLTSALKDQDGQLKITTDDLAKYIDKSSAIGKDPAMVDALNKAGLSFNDLAGFASQGEEGLKKFIVALEAAGVLDKEIQHVGSSARYASGAFGDISETVTVAGESFRNTGGTGNQLVNTFSDLQKTSEEAAKQQLATAVADQKLTQAQVDAAEKNHKLSDTTTDYIGVLNELQPGIASTTTAEEDSSKAADEAKQKHDALLVSLHTLATTYPDVAAAMNGATGAVGDNGVALEQLVISLNKAGISGADLDTVAAGLGVTTVQLQGFIKDVTGQLDSFVSTAVKGLPDVSSAIDSALDPKKHADKPIVIDPKKLEDELQQSIDEINAFNDNLQFLVDSGFNNLAKVAAQRGPEFTAALRTSIENGDNVGEALNSKFAELEAVTAAEPDKLRVVGQGIVVATGEIAGDASKNFGDQFQLAPPTQAQVDQARLVAELANVPFSEALKSVAGQGAVAYEQALGVIPGDTQTAMSGAQGAIDAAADPLGTKAQNAGGSVSSSFTSGMSGLPGGAGDIVGSAATTINNATWAVGIQAFTSGALVGAEFDDGISAGIDKYIGEIETSARNAVSRAKAAASSQAQAHSPSKLFAELGRDIARGLAYGIVDETGVVAAAGASMVDAAVPALTPSSAAQVDAARHVAAAIGSSSAVVGGGYSSADSGAMFRDLVVQVTATPGMTRADAETIGSTVAGAVVDRLTPAAARRLVVSTRVSG